MIEARGLTRIPLRNAVFVACLILLLVSLVGVVFSLAWLWGVAIFGMLAGLGLYDLRQTQRTVSRNYPVLAHFRYVLESIGPEIRQYFIQSDLDERPFSREQRAVVYQRAKNESDKKPFGSLLDMYQPGHEWINHSLLPCAIENADFRVRVGGSHCSQPYLASVLNISAMSFGSLSGNAIEALNAGACKGGFYHDTGEGSISRYHRRHGGDLVWEIGSGYFGCRHDDGSFNEERFAANASDDQVKMIEIKLSQGAKPGHGGILPAAKVTAEIAEAREVPMGQDVISPAAHSAFSTPLELMDFIARLRSLSGGKPVGFKLAIGHPWEWFAIVKAMLESGERPDFIVVDGGEGGTGAAPLEFINRMGVPLTEAVTLVHNTLVGVGLREEIRIGAAGKIMSGFHIARTLALGADWCNSARGFMFSLGCIQALNCHSDKCPSGVATQDPKRSRHLDIADKTARVYHFHRNTLKALAEMLGAAGLSHPSELGPEHIIRRVSENEIQSYDQIFTFLKPNELLNAKCEHTVFKHYWENARADSFQPPAQIARLRFTKLE
ncbi:MULTISPECIES: FMN-binding glutamate synthase family protein [unclassified Halomonas]|uniref:FMN-binding glutamate synthase family protein n=1 Tax=unclassified Halomonas TaxID=2609666 RepID=UPI001CF1ADC0|nr:MULTISPECIES: FMN-binding glutamate synthase family protein [unclassified Halomonas]MCA8863762.1 FMN-binding glutamate synthase family protein [Halomonas sp. SBBP1]UZH11003.1 FMN-binding glutamate synthase family protein [Halomonas sp. BDJS001]